MKTPPVAEISKTRLAKDMRRAFDQVTAGTVLGVTAYRQPVAYIVRADIYRELLQIAQAADQLRELRPGPEAVVQEERLVRIDVPPYKANPPG